MNELCKIAKKLKTARVQSLKTHGSVDGPFYKNQLKLGIRREYVFHILHSVGKLKIMSWPNVTLVRHRPRATLNCGYTKATSDTFKKILKYCTLIAVRSTYLIPKIYLRTFEAEVLRRSHHIEKSVFAICQIAVLCMLIVLKSRAINFPYSWPELVTCKTETGSKAG